MNICVISGRLVRESLKRADSKSLWFLTATRYRHQSENVKEGTTVVPCVLFFPSKEVEALLNEEAKGTIYVEGTGRIQQRTYDGEGGEKKYVTEVVLDAGTVSMRRQ
jgi:single-strand DNA-binding protein